MYLPRSIAPPMPSVPVTPMAATLRSVRLRCIARHSLGIYGFHALIVHALRASHLELSRWPLLDIVWIFSAALLGSLLLSGLVQRIDSRRLVS